MAEIVTQIPTNLNSGSFSRDKILSLEHALYVFTKVSYVILWLWLIPFATWHVLLSFRFGIWVIISFLFL